MKRTYKFRAWVEGNEMVRVSGIQFEPDSPLSKPCIIDERNDIHQLKDIELMEWTGFKDEKGNDIYENDIIRLNDIKYIVKWDLNCSVYIAYQIQGKGDGIMNLFYLVINNSSEVIGNIFQNPELLNKEQEGEIK